MPTTPPSITALPAVPDRADRATFSTRATNYFDALKNTFTAEVQAVAANAYANATDAAGYASTASTHASTATTQAGLAESAKLAAQAAQAAAEGVVATIPDGTINDAATSTTGVWSSSKVSTELAGKASTASVAAKQDTLVSGTNIKTVGGVSLLGSGNVSVGTGDVVGPASSVSGRIATFSGTTGKLIQDSGVALPTGALVGTTDTQTLTNKTLQSANITSGLTLGGAAGTSGQVLTSQGSGSAPIWSALASSMPYFALSANTTLTVTHKGAFVRFTAGSNFTLTAASTLGAGWYVILANDYGLAISPGTSTVFPSGADTIDGRTSCFIQAGTVFLIVCDGTGFHTTRLQGSGLQFLTSGTSWTCPAGVRFAKITCIGGGGGGGGGHATGSAGAGGGSGGVGVMYADLQPGTAYTYAIGAAGSAGTVAGIGGAGGSTTFTVGSVTATGGGGSGGSAGVSSTTALVFGGNGGSSNVPDSSSGFTAGGEKAMPTMGTTSGPGANPPSFVCPGAYYGKGGQGGNVNAAGSVGYAGLIIIEY